MAILFTFPGQGSQSIGMGHDFYTQFPAARAVFEEIDDALNQQLSRLIFEGDEKELALTENTQPALMAVSMAMVRTIEHELKSPISSFVSHMAGHSLGEYTAYCASQTFSLSDTARILRIRGQAMQRAVPIGIGSMAAILGLEIEEIQILVEEATHSSDDLCVVANDNCPGQVVVSGHTGAISRILELASKKGAKRGIILHVSAPFHSPLMASAAQELSDFLTDIPITFPESKIISNVTTRPIEGEEEIKPLLIQQVTHPVRWRESMLGVKKQSITHVVEVGAGKVLTGLIKRIDPTLHASSFHKGGDLDPLLHLLQTQTI